MARFFLQAGQLQDGQVAISGDEAHHISRVLRLQVGDTITCVDVDEAAYTVTITELGATVRGNISAALEVTQESPLHLTLFQGLAKGDKMDLVIQKAVELGVQTIVPYTSRYTIVKLDPKQAKTRQERWARIALEAAKQCGRTRIPEVVELRSFKDVVAAVQSRKAQDETIVLAYEGEKRLSIRDLPGPPQAASVLVGPEGGFAPEEVADLVAAGATACTLGPRILRTETAGLVALSLLGYKWGDLA